MKSNRSSILLAALMILAVAAGASAQTATWEIDASHSTIGFGVKHLMVSTVRGQFNSFTASMQTTGDDPATAKLTVSIDAASIDTRVAKRDEHLKSADFFEVAKFPTITFVSKKVEKTASGLKITGDLTMRDVTKEVVLEVSDITGPITDPYGNSRVGAHATTTVNRKDFGLKYNAAMETGGLVVANEVTLVLDVEFVKQKAAATK